MTRIFENKALRQMLLAGALFTFRCGAVYADPVCLPNNQALWGIRMGATTFDVNVNPAHSQSSTYDTNGNIGNCLTANSVTASIPGGAAFSAADLTTGTLGGSSSGANANQDVASGFAELHDRIFLNIPGANAATVTNIAVDVTMDGNEALPAIFRETHGLKFFFGPAVLTYSVDQNTISDAGTSSGWVSAQVLTSTVLSFRFHGVIAVQGATPSIDVLNQIRDNCDNGGACDFTHGSKITLGLPAGVSFTSASTVFLSANPTLSVNRKVLNYGSSGSLVTSPQSVLVAITGAANVPWTATSDHSNITVSPASGTGTGTFQVTASPGSSGVVTVSSPGLIGSPQTITVNIASTTPTAPFGSFDTPITNTTGVVGAIPVTGWALDNIEVTRVDIFREAVSGEPSGNLIFIGTAVFSADARPDVATQFAAYPYQFRAGWGYQMLTNFLPNASGSGAPGNGTYKLHAIAFNKAGSQLDLGTRTITVDNAHAAKPFGTIDTPGQGGTISGPDSVNFGWALTPQTALIPIDGSTLTVVIDGVGVGHPVYNNLRSDIANLFPGYANSMGAVGFFHINTTTLTNGVHTISWNVFDNLGRGEGLGSRYFNVLNAGTGAGAVPGDVIDEAVAREGVRVRHGLDINREPDPIAPDGDGGYSVTMEEVGHIELHLGAATGNMLVAGEAQALPTGSTLKGGIFYWQPGPGFLGEYTMQFARPDGSSIPVRVRIVPKRFAIQ